jgi:hypothetical protein
LRTATALARRCRLWGATVSTFIEFK